MPEKRPDQGRGNRNLWPDRMSPIHDSLRGQTQKSWMRENLGSLSAGALVISLCAVFGKDLYETAYSDSKKTLTEIEDVIGDFEGHETIKKPELIPEDERSGKNLMVAASPMRMALKKSGYRDFFEETFKTMFDVLPEGTTIHLVTPEDSSELALEVAREMFPKLNFVILNMPPTHPGLEYAQDTFFATGGFDEKGRSVLATSTCDHDYWKTLTDDGPLQAPATWDEALPFGNQRKKAFYGVPMMGDEILAKRYPQKFMDKDVPVRTEGGDIHITRMPNGKIALVVGLKNLAETILYGIKDPETGLFVNEAVYPGATTTFSFMDRAKEMYKKAFDVDEVILAGEDFIELAARDQSMKIDGVREKYGSNKNPRLERVIYEESFVPPYNKFFFHLDMALKTVTTPSGESVAFCTEFTRENAIRFVDSQFPKPQEYEMDEGYKRYMEDRKRNLLESVWRETAFLRILQEQFSQLGYKIVKLPCGPFPAMNYTNSVVFMGEGSEKIAIVPQYGIPEDAQAVEAYKSLGFKVFAPLYKDLIDSTIENQNGLTQKAMEEVGLKDKDIGLLGIGSYHCRTVVLGEVGQKVFSTPEDPDKENPKTVKAEKPRDKHANPSYKKHTPSVPKKGRTHSPDKKKDFQRRKR